MRRFLLPGLCIVFAFAAVASGTTSKPGSASALREHVDRLASDEMDGRMTGTEGAQRARDYLSGRLKEFGARPLPGRKDFLLPFEFTAGMNDGGSSISLAGAGEPRSWNGKDRVQALSFSDSKSVSGEVVFAGYGLVLPDSEDFSYDSYFGLDVDGKIVVVLRYYPEDTEGEIRAALARYAGLRYKALQARERGAKALVVVTGPRSPNAGTTVPMTFDTALSGSGIVAASVSGDVADAIFAAVPDGLEKSQAALDTGNPHAQGFAIPGIELTLQVEVEREKRQAYNVVGWLPGSEQAAGDEVVVLGAHYDHLGRGEHGNSLADKDEVGQVHYGADDNASGVALVLEVGRELAARPASRPVVLAFWAGEELGILGSNDFISSKVLKTEDILAYLNFDMVGRMRDNRLTLQAVGSSSVWPSLIERANVAAGFDANIQEDPYLPTDSTVFYQAGVPTLNFFTGGHEQYHRPSDKPGTLNFADLERIVGFAGALTRNLAGATERPDYKTVARKREEGGGRDGVRAFTGTIPDYTTEVDGLRLSGVIEGGPADEAGLQAGDVIIEFGGTKIANIYDYTYALDAVKIGEPLRVVYRRGEETREAVMTPTSRR